LNGLSFNGSWSPLYTLRTDSREDTVSISSSTVACLSAAAIILQRPLFKEPLLSSGYFMAVYFALVA
jgi:hypothetical protein